jgi:steroid 5-alpha reductase family enzyme
MNKNIIWISGILGSVLVASLVAFAGSLDGMKIAGVPVFLGCALFAFLVQWVAYVPAFIFQTEKYFDLLGSMTYLALAVTILFLTGLEPGSIVISVMVIIWAVRLGSFLFIRVQQAGYDSRFRTIKPDFLQFLMTWTMQGLWVFLTFSAGLAAMTSGREHPIDAFVATGCVLWLTGFLIEVIADRQKTDFRKIEGNKDRFISTGLWAKSRHPNYFGEILLWTGIAVAAFPVLEGWQYVTLVSPLFVFLLLTKVSGVRMLEHQAKRKWGREPEFSDYCERTPMLVLNPFLKSMKS